uniref:Uncharacterized protein n=1 Tax=Arundo donax TaxID=35708 RepID=A0A0A9CW96_ARUDO
MQITRNRPLNSRTSRCKCRCRICCRCTIKTCRQHQACATKQHMINRCLNKIVPLD